MSYAYAKRRQRVWRAPIPADVRALLFRGAEGSSPVGASPPATATESKLRSLALDLAEPTARTAPSPNLLTFWELWEAMAERPGFYIRKPFWADRHRFLVANVTEHNERPGHKVLLGRFCEGPAGSRPGRISQELDLRTWEFAGVAAWRREQDGFQP